MKQNEYLLLFRGDEWYRHLSSDELQRVIEQSKSWLDRLAAEGKVKGFQALARQGTIVSGKSSRIIADGPFIESKEAIGGYLLLQANSLEEAVAIAKTSPSIPHGTSIEVRPVTDECPLNHRFRQLQAEVQPAAA
jgi:hypothetical protein